MTDTQTLVLSNCYLIDATSPTPREASVFIADGRIQDVTPSSHAASSTANVIDLAGAFVLPGLWDVHTHIGRGIPDIEARDEPIAERTIRAGQNCINALNLGITGIRVVGEKEFIDVAWKRAFDSGQFVGPSLFTCGYFITTTAGHFLKSGCAIEVDGPDEYRRVIREQIKNGVDFIKLNLTGGVMGPTWDKMANTFPLPDELETAFELCHRRGFKVAAHAGGIDGIKTAIRLGAHTLEHGYLLDDEAIAAMAENGTYFVPTLALTHLNRGPDYATNDFEREWAIANPIQEDYRLRAVDAAKAHAEGFRKAVDAGVKIACGSDINLPYGGLFELGMLVNCGMSEWQAIVAATQTSAEACCVGDDYGTVEAGKVADLIALKANPLDDILNIRKLAMVVKNGMVVKRA